MNDSNDTRDRREELGLFGSYKVLILSVKWYSVIGKWTWMNCKCVHSSLRGIVGSVPDHGNKVNIAIKRVA